VDDKFTYEHYLKIILGNYRDDLRYIDWANYTYFQVHSSM
jgi:hypothetical protein